LARYEKLNIAPYKGFLNPWLKPVYGAEGEMVDVEADYSESYAEQMLRYSRDYGFLI
jgi:dipeptidyl-peptidase-3